MGELTKENG
jgi:hypothetical protein